MNNEKWYVKLFEYFMLMIGAGIMAAALNLLLAPNVIAPGGITGFAVVINKVTGIPIYITNLLINIPLFLFGAKILGRVSAARTFFTTAVFTLILGFTPLRAFTDDLLLSAIFGGILTGLGLGVVFRYGGTTGGTDLAGAIMNRKNPNLKISSFMMIIDLFVVVLAGLVEKKIEISLYSIIALYSSVKMVDLILEGPNYSKAFYIITNQPEEIARVLMEELERGVTALQAKGMYTKANKEVLLCVVNRTQFSRVKEIVHEYDPNAFIMVTEIMEVLGEGFSYNTPASK